MHIADHWLQDAHRIISPNADERAEAETISLLVVHGISLPPGRYGGDYIARLFCNQLTASEHPYFAEICQLRVSSHLLIDRVGRITQFVPFHRRAWHAGRSRFGDREACNDFSIGIELEGCDTEPYREEQYQRLAQVSKCLMTHYEGITPQRICGHSDIAPGRKTDPGEAFDWDYFFKLLAETE